jgi:hypothetical protein
MYQQQSNYIVTETKVIKQIPQPTTQSEDNKKYGEDWLWLFPPKNIWFHFHQGNYFNDFYYGAAGAKGVAVKLSFPALCFPSRLICPLAIKLL